MKLWSACILCGAAYFVINLGVEAVFGYWAQLEFFPVALAGAWLIGRAGGEREAL